MIGYVTPPDDLGPAIAALAPQARERLYARIGERSPTPEDLVEAADWWTAKQETEGA